MSWLLALALLLAVVDSTAELSGDGIALLAVKKAIKFDPAGVLAGWSEDKSSDFCSWAGVGCSSSSSGDSRTGTVDRRVSSLNLTGPSSLLGSCSSGHSDSWENDRIQESFSSSSLEACMQHGSCGLDGVLAPEIGNLSELTSLVLGFNRFRGGIPRELSKLRKLRVLDLRENGFEGHIPEELGEIPSLEVLNLEGNRIDGPIPVGISRCRNLIELSLGGNKLSGGIPSSLGALSRLRRLSLEANQMSSFIPAGLEGICESLEHLDLGSNFFILGIPAWLGNCSKLGFLVLKSNYLRGEIPSELGRLRMLRVLDVSMNGLTGRVPASLGYCSEMLFLVLTHPSSCASQFNCTAGIGIRGADKPEFNQFVGDLPSSIAKLPKLQLLWAPHSQLSGAVPIDWGECSNLRSINLAGNSFGGDFPRGLGKCSSLTYLDLSSNSLEGELPMELPSGCMIAFNVSKNRLSGDIPSRGDYRCNLTLDTVPYPSFCSGNPFCGKLRSESCLGSGTTVVVHDLSGNRFSGPVPAPLIGDSFLEEQPEYRFDLSDNQLQGNISSSFFAFCGRFRGFVANLSSNRITGELSGQDLGRCKSLLGFLASTNRLEGGLPEELGNLTNLATLDLSRNRLTGNIPPELGELQALTSLLLANNSLLGRIPESLGEASSLSLLDISGNNLVGSIPSSLSNLTHLEYLILNNNNISGTIPSTLSGINSLVSVNFAFNNLSGSVPSSGSWAGICDNEHFQGNPYLKPCPSAAAFGPGYMDDTVGPVAAPLDSPGGGGLNVVVIVAITSGCAVAVVLLVLALLVQCTKQRVPRPPRNRGGRKEVVLFTNLGFRFTYENVVRATGNFSVDYLIGTGGFGATYKAEMMPGLVVAVKRLAIGRFQGVQQFDTEIRTLGRIQHSNLVKLIGYHASEGEMFLIYNYFPRGNLESFIHTRSRGEISWGVVHKIALGIAEALAYLHDECQPRVLHRDIKPSNILLDNNLTAFLADFGLARLLGASETHATTDVAGTFGYVAPEYAMTCRVSDKADVYSYGVVLLELLSGKKALDPAFSDYGHGFTIVGWACLLIGQGRAHEVFIVELWEMGPETYLLETLKLAVMCTVDSLTMRPTMRQVVDRLRHMDQLSLPFS